MERLFLVSLRVLIIRVLIINSFDDSFLCNVECECDPSSLSLPPTEKHGTRFVLDNEVTRSRYSYFAVHINNVFLYLLALLDVRRFQFHLRDDHRIHRECSEQVVQEVISDASRRSDLVTNNRNSRNEEDVQHPRDGSSTFANVR